MLKVVTGTANGSSDIISEARAALNISLSDRNDRRHRLNATKHVIYAEGAIGSFTVRGDDDQLYHFDGVTNQVRRVYDGPRLADEWGALLLNRYNIAPSEDAARLVTEHICAPAYKHPKKTVKRFSSYDAEKNVLYLSRYDGTAWKLDGKTITVVRNGEDVLFVDDDEGNVVMEPDIGPDQGLLNALVNDLEYVAETGAGLQEDGQVLLLSVWLHAVAFADAIPGKPTLILVGAAGSGKSMAVKRIQQVVHGQVWISGIAKDASEEDFAVSLLKHPIAPLDNVDSYVDWLGEALATYATGSGWVRRRRYTDTEQSKVKPRAFIAITSRNPKSFHRDDVADRLIILRLKRRDKFGNEAKILEELIKKRPQLYGEWLYNLNRIVALMPTRLDEEIDEQFRLSDFASFLRIAARSMGFTDELINDTLLRARAEQEELAADGDSVVEILLRYFDVEENRKFYALPQSARAWFDALRFSFPTDFKFHSVHQFEMQLQQKWRSIQRRLTAQQFTEAKTTTYAFWELQPHES